MKFHGCVSDTIAHKSDAGLIQAWVGKTNFFRRSRHQHKKIFSGAPLVHCVPSNVERNSSNAAAFRPLKNSANKSCIAGRGAYDGARPMKVFLVVHWDA